MRKLFVTTCALTILSLLFFSPTALSQNMGDNILDNSSSYFENGYVGGWYAPSYNDNDGYASVALGTPGYDGSAGCMVLENTLEAVYFNAQAAYDFEYSLPRRKYQLSFYAKAGSDGLTLDFGYQKEPFLNGDMNGMVFALSTEWEYYTITFDSDFGDIARVFFNFAQNVGTIYIDNIIFKDMGDAAPEPEYLDEPEVSGNMLTGDSYHFNGGTVGYWQGLNNAEFYVGIAKHGSDGSEYCMRVINPISADFTDSQVAYYCSFQSGHTYRYSFKAKTDETAEIKTAITVYDSNNDYLYLNTCELTDEWQEFSGTIDVPSNGSNSFLFLIGKDVAKYYIDHIIITEVGDDPVLTGEPPYNENNILTEREYNFNNGISGWQFAYDRNGGGLASVFASAPGYAGSDSCLSLRNPVKQEYEWKSMAMKMLSQSYPSGTYTVSLYVKTDIPDENVYVGFYVDNGHYGTCFNIEVTNEWSLYTKTFSASFDFDRIEFDFGRIEGNVYIDCLSLTPGEVVPCVNIEFADANIKEICIANWDNNGNGELDTDEAAAVTSLNGAFRNQTAIKYFCELRYFSGLTEIADDDFSGCTNLLALEWNKEGVTVPRGIMTQPNAILYVGPNVTSLYEGITVRDGVAGDVVLTDAMPLYIPRAFVASSIRYTRNFSMQTIPGVSAGWETIVLPFDVQSITHQTKGSITPFNSWYYDYGKKFWLGTLGQGGGFVSALSISANVPYIISMPNSTLYNDEYNLNGNVTFAAYDAWVYPTTEAGQIQGASFNLLPAYEIVGSSTSVYAINQSQYDGYAAGSVFVRDSRSVEPFESYISPLQFTSARPYFIIGDNGTTSIRYMETDIQPDSQTDLMYNIYGMPVDENYHGIVIMNGVKYLK